MKTILGQLRQKTHEEAEFLDGLDAAITGDPVFARRIYAALVEHFGSLPKANGEAPKRGRPPKRDDDQRKLIDNALEGKGWIGTPELRRVTGIPKGQLRAAMRSAPGKYEHRKDPENARRLQWRLKQTEQD